MLHLQVMPQPAPAMAPLPDMQPAMYALKPCKICNVKFDMHIAYNKMRKQHGCYRLWHLIGLVHGSLTSPVSAVAHSSVVVDGKLPLCMQTALADCTCCAVHPATHARSGPCPPWWLQGTYTHQKCPLCHTTNA